MAKKLKTLQVLVDRVKRSNARFEAATVAKKRVMVAKDIIAAIEAGSFKAEEGSYMSFEDSDFGPGHLLKNPSQLSDEEPGGSFREFMGQVPACNLCAKGAILMCAIARQNNVTNETVENLYFDNEELSDVLGGLFSPKQLRLIECEFEGRDVVHDSWDPDSVQLYPKMNLTRLRPPTRLKRIMKNIIENDGYLIP